MASLFRSRRRSFEDERGSGGKILRGRRAAPLASPYQRPPPPPPAQPRNPSWLSGLLSGAGKLISSVFGSDDSSPSSDYSSDDDIISTSSESGDIDASAGGFHELNQRGKKQGLIRDHGEASSAIVPKSEPKLTIEQLLLQETFSRDECNKLTEILKSRVVDYPSAEVGDDGRQKIPNNTSGSASSFLGHQSFNQHSELQDALFHSSNILDTSPGFSVLQSRSPDLSATAVMEAKKWLEDKKLASSSNGSLYCGPCTLNTDMLHYGIDGDGGSPVDMAKSFMRSLPPWQSPSLCNIGSTPPPSRTHLYKDETYAAASHSLSLAKVLKRNYLASEPWDNLDEIRRVRMKLGDNLLDIPNYRPIDPSTILLDHITSKISSTADKRELHESTNPTTSIPSDSVIGGEAKLSDPDADIFDEKQASKLEEALNAGQSIQGIAMPITSVPSDSVLGCETTLLDPDSEILDEKQDVEEPSLTKEQVENFSLPNESLVLNSTHAEDGGDPLSEAKILSPEETKLSDPSDAVTNHQDVNFPIGQTSSGTREKLQSNRFSKLTDSRHQDEDAQIHKEAERSRDKISANGAPGEYNTNSGLESHTNEQDLLIPEGTCSLLSEMAVDIPVSGTNTRMGKSTNGTRLKSIERMLTETKSGTSRHGRKTVVQSRRGRGRGRGRGRIK